MSWHTVLVTLGSIGACGFLIIGLIMLFSGLGKDQQRDYRQQSWYKKPRVLAGTGMLCFALFVGLFVASVASTDYVVKIVTILVGLIIFFPAVIFMLLGLSFFRMRSRNEEHRK